MLAGANEVSFSGFRVPKTAGVESVEFKLVTGNATVKKIEAAFIADYPETRLGLTSTEKNRLSQLYAPTLIFNGRANILGTNYSERFNYPFDVSKTTWPKRNDGKIHRIGDSSDAYSLEDYAPNDGRIYSSSDRDAAPMIYASIVRKPTESTTVKPQSIAINYWFHYLRSDWGEQGGWNTHEGDWEGVTVFLNYSAAIKDWVPGKAAFSQHINSWLSDGGQNVSWSDIQRNQTHPLVYVGLGGHASYPFPGATMVANVDRPYFEMHNGNGQRFVPSQRTITTLQRINRFKKIWQAKCQL